MHEVEEQVLSHIRTNHPWIDRIEEDYVARKTAYLLVERHPDKWNRWLEMTQDTESKFWVFSSEEVEHALDKVTIDMRVKSMEQRNAALRRPKYTIPRDPNRGRGGYWK